MQILLFSAPEVGPLGVAPIGGAAVVARKGLLSPFDVKVNKKDVHSLVVPVSSVGKTVVGLLPVAGAFHDKAGFVRPFKARVILVGFLPPHYVWLVLITQTLFRDASASPVGTHVGRVSVAWAPVDASILVVEVYLGLPVGTAEPSYSRKPFVVVIDVHRPRESYLLKVADAGCSARPFSCLGECRQQHCR